MTRPVANKYPVSLGFGARYPWHWRYRWNSPLRFLAGVKHRGTDFSCPIGTQVKAPIDLVVTQIHKDKRHAYGRHIWALSKDGSVRLLFAHLDIISRASRPGKEWHESEVFCWSGNTGKFTSGAHLHFGTQRKINGKWYWIDPLEIYGQS